MTSIGLEILGMALAWFKLVGCSIPVAILWVSWKVVYVMGMPCSIVDILVVTLKRFEILSSRCQCVSNDSVF